MKDVDEITRWIIYCTDFEKFNANLRSTSTKSRKSASCRVRLSSPELTQIMYITVFQRPESRNSHLEQPAK